MTGWANSDRRRRLPADWRHRRERTLRRDPICRCGTRTPTPTGCQHRPGECPFPSTEAYHAGRLDDHDDLQGLCTPCHRRKTVAERPAAQRRRPPEAHPGLT